MSEPAAIAAIVLAAGAATRMGRLKQLLPYGGGTLAGHAIEQAIEAGFKPVIVVTGAENASVQEAVRRFPVEIVFNERWQLGMGSSIIAGLKHAEAYRPAMVAIMLADQPLVTARHLKEMARLLEEGQSKIVAAEYNRTLGVPALFRREMFGELLSLDPEAGARHILRRGRVDTATYLLPEAGVDIDTPEQFSALQNEGTYHNI